MGTKTRFTVISKTIEIRSEKRIPKHGDENKVVIVLSIFLSAVKKGSPNMETSDFKILFLLFFDKMAICMPSCYN